MNGEKMLFAGEELLRRVRYVSFDVFTLIVTGLLVVFGCVGS